MSEIKWIKITTSMFEDEKLKLIDAMPERDTIHYVWIRLLVQAGKTNAGGMIFLNENIPYTEEMLSTIFNRPVNSIRFALDTLKKFAMIIVDDKNLIKIKNWDRYQNIEGMERVRAQSRLRMKKLREKQKKIKAQEESEEAEISNVTVTQCDVTVTEQKERERKNIEEEIEVEKREKVKKDEIVNGVQLRLDEDNEEEKITEDAIKVLGYYENLTGIVGVFNLAALKTAITVHGKEHLIEAIEKAIEVNKVNMTYINGILRNWVKEGYPKREVSIGRGKGSSDDNKKFEGFKPQKSRTVTEEERKKSEGVLI